MPRVELTIKNYLRVLEGEPILLNKQYDVKKLGKVIEVIHLSINQDGIGVFAGV